MVPVCATDPILGPVGGPHLNRGKGEMPAAGKSLVPRYVGIDGRNHTFQERLIYVIIHIRVIGIILKVNPIINVIYLRVSLNTRYV